jgi:hypothetical protein
MKGLSERSPRKGTTDNGLASWRSAPSQNLMALTRRSLRWAEDHVPGGDRAVPCLRMAARRAIRPTPAPPLVMDNEAPFPRPSPTIPAPVTPEIPVDISTMTVFRAEHFPDSGPHPWLDGPDAEARVADEERLGNLGPHDADLCRYWSENGYVILPGLIEESLLDYVWAAYEERINSGVLKPPTETQFEGDRVPGRVLDPHLKVPAIEDLMHHSALLDKVQLLLGAECTPFQSISGHKASQQDIHSDSIHMTTYPAGYLAAMWIAFEDIEPGSGPLEYYPGSHRLPTVYSREAGISETAIRESGYAEFDRKYTPLIRKKIKDLALTPHHFHARKGDVLIWHANLMHGGSVRTDFTRTRRALVFHYFAKGCICYHDLSASLSRLHV